MASGSILKLPEEISIANVTEWKNKLVDFTSEPAPYVLDGADLSRLDTAAIQLLVAFVNKLESQNKEMEWQNPSPVLIKTAEQLGLKAALLIQE